MAEDAKEEEYVVVTRVTPVRANGRIVVHVYGPYTRSRAQNTKEGFLRQARELKYIERLEVNCCKLLGD